MSYSHPARRRRAYRPRFEVLEARHLLSTYVVDNLGDSGAGSGLAGDLRYCINQAADGDAITFGVTGTIQLGEFLGSLDLAHNISIEGPGADLLTISGLGYSADYPFRVFTVLQGATVSISGLTITNGYAPYDGYSEDANLGGGIANFGTLTLSNSTVTGNRVDSCWNPNGCFDVTAPTSGGGIFNGNAAGTAVLTLINSTVSHNYAYAEGLGTSGGGIANGVSVDDYRYPLGGTVILSNSTVSGNHTDSSGGGGGIFTGGGGMLMVTNSTVSGNVAYSDGGGIYNLGSSTTLTIANSTIAGNVSGNGVGGISNHSHNAFAMRNTIVAGNRGSEGLPDDLAGYLTGDGYNLIGNTNGRTGFDPTDLLNVDPRLGPLQDNGGPTLTQALLPGSPAIDAGDNTDAPMWDQRGAPFRRIVHGTIDIGAFEVQARGYPRPTPQPLPDPVPVQALGMPAGPLFAQPPALPAASVPLLGSEAPNDPVGQPGADPVPQARGQQAPDSFTAAVSDGQPGDPVGLLSTIPADLPALGLAE
jgi:hypothetical protein